MLNIVIAAIGVALGGILAFLAEYMTLKRRKKFEKFVPHIELTDGNHVKKMERFGDYVVRQLGLSDVGVSAQRLVGLAEAYLRGDKSSTDDSIEEVMNLLSNCLDAPDITSLNEEMLEELDACMYSYFAFHWDYGPEAMKQVLNSGNMKKLRRAVLSATRDSRLKKATRFLTTRYVFHTVVDRFKAMGRSNSSLSQGTVLVPAERNTRSPVLLLIGGGMGAGKSTVVKELLKCPFWAGAAQDAVVVEADAFKETAHVHRPEGQGPFEEGHLVEADQLVHQLSTDAASSLLVTALNEGRDVIFDGTMSWEPFVLQTIEMARDVHKRRYRMGPGYQVSENGLIEEKYWEPIQDMDSAMERERTCMPYRIELVGVICDAHLAVVRGMRRAILTKRAVPIKGQLRSHRLFAASLEKYCEEVDMAKIYSTSDIHQGTELIGWKEGQGKLLKNCEAFQTVKALATLNPNATSVLELYENPKQGEILNRVFREVVLDTRRKSRQDRLREALQTISLPSYSRTTSDVSSTHSSFSRQSSDSSISTEENSSGSLACSS